MPTNVLVELTVGIPSAAVLYAVLGYGGAFNGGVKCKPSPNVNLDKSGAASLTLPQLVWGMTHQYNEADAPTVAGKPDWFRSLQAGAQPVDGKTLARTPDNLNVEFVHLQGATHAVKFTVVGANPMLTIAPAIDAEIVVGLRKSGGGIQFAVKGEHDGFPNYTLVLNGRQVYAWDCVAKGESPAALGPPMDQSVDIAWQDL
jgi:hypothetical protein